jgi:DNA adenine methylase
MALVKQKKLIAFNYFGAKVMHLDWLLPKLPDTEHFVDVFGGSGSVIINKKPSRIESFNDLDGEVINFFEVLRNQRSKLIEQITLTPYSEKEFKISLKHRHEGTNLERARRFFIYTSQGFASHQHSGWKYSIHTSGACMSESVSRTLKKIPGLYEIAERFRTIQIFNQDFRKLITRCDRPGILFYCDPPYVRSTRTGHTDYVKEMTDDDHIDLLNLANRVKAYIAISGYDNPMYNDLLRPENGFYKSYAAVRRTNYKKSESQEVLWTNYDPKAIHNQYLF